MTKTPNPAEPDKQQAERPDDDVAQTEQHGNQSSEDMANEKSSQIDKLAKHIKEQPAP